MDVNDDGQLDAGVAPDNGQPTPVSQQASQPSAPQVSGQPDAQEDKSQSAPDNGQPDASEVAAKREAGELAKLQREQAETKARLAELEQDRERLRRIEEVATSSPENYEDALVKYNGMDRAAARAQVESLRAQGHWQPQQPVQQIQQQAQPQANPYDVVEEVLLKREVQSEFFKQVPELDLKNVAPEKVEAIKLFTNSIGTAASKNLEAKGILRPTAQQLTTELITVYKDFTGRTDDQLQEAREQGRVEGMAEATVVRAGSTSATRGYTPKSTAGGLTADELQQAEAEGYTPEQWQQLKDPVTRVK